MKRWAAGLVAVLFLAAATLHVFAHHGAADSDCGVCSVQQASLPSAPAPVVAAAPLPEADLAQPAVLRPRSARPAAAAARAPPVLTA
jgi:hypothetical protein